MPTKYTQYLKVGMILLTAHIDGAHTICAVATRHLLSNVEGIGINTGVTAMGKSLDKAQIDGFSPY